MSVKEYLTKIKPNSTDIINNLKNSDTWKIQLKLANSVISSRDNDEERVIYSKSVNIQIIINAEADEVKNNLQSIKGNEFIFNYVHLMYYKCHKVNPNHGHHIQILLIG